MQDLVSKIKVKKQTRFFTCDLCFYVRLILVKVHVLMRGETGLLMERPIEAEEGALSHLGDENFVPRKRKAG